MRVAPGRWGFVLQPRDRGDQLITGLADAMMDSVPVVAITGQVARDFIGTDAFQEIDVLGMSLSCTKHSFLVTDAAELGTVMAEAFRIACSGRPGPVLIDVPKDIQMAAVEPRAPMHLVDDEAPLWSRPWLRHGHCCCRRTANSILGGGVVLADAVTELRALAATCGLPAGRREGDWHLDPACGLSLACWGCMAPRRPTMQCNSPICCWWWGRVLMIG
jgi:acetolactate synthase-1/2/3 large subunit